MFLKSKKLQNKRLFRDEKYIHFYSPQYDRKIKTKKNYSIEKEAHKDTYMDYRVRCKSDKQSSAKQRNYNDYTDSNNIV